MEKITNKAQWKLSVALLISLIIGIELVRKIGNILSNFFAANDYLGIGVTGIEGAIVIGLEMSIAPLLISIAIAMAMSFTRKEIFSLAWKVLVIGAAIGAIVGATYSSGMQNFYCGYIK